VTITTTAAGTLSGVTTTQAMRGNL
jgi:hypothetical protein